MNPNLNLDLMGSFGSGVISVCLFYLYLFSSPKRSTWMTWPHYVRYPVGAAAAVTMVQSAQLGAVPSMGHLSALSVLVFLTLACAIGAITLWAGRRALADRGHDRLEHVFRAEQSDPSLVPVILTQDEVVDTIRAMGGRAVAPRAAPHELNDPPRRH